MTKKKLLAGFLAIMLAFGGTNLPAFAADEEVVPPQQEIQGDTTEQEASPIVDSSEQKLLANADEIFIAAFEPFDEVRQKVVFGTPFEDLNLPTSLKVKTGADLDVVDIDVTWESDKAYDGEIPGVYSFVAVPDDEATYSLIGNITWPTIEVTVQDQEQLVQSLSGPSVQSNTPIDIAATGDLVLSLSQAGSGGAYKLEIYDQGALVDTHVQDDMPVIQVTSAQSVVVKWVGGSAIPGSMPIILDTDIDRSADAGVAAFALDAADPARVDLSTTSGATLLSGSDRAGIEVPQGTSLTLVSGSIDATGGQRGAGIGGGAGESAGTISINDGIVTAHGNGGAAGIGGGKGGSGGTITIEQGTVNAFGSTRDSSDNSSGSGAGIGGGSGRYQSSTFEPGGDGGTITINGGTVNAQGGTIDKGGAAIGGGYAGDGGSITINDGTVIAESTTGGAAIGGGLSGDGGTIPIAGGDVDANGRGNGSSGIGGGKLEYGKGARGGEITIIGGKVTAKGANQAASIGGGASGDSGVIKISGGTVVAGKSEGSASGGVGIGTGSYMTASVYHSLESIHITGNANVTAYGGYSDAAIGTGNVVAGSPNPNPGGTITIDGNAQVTAAGGNGGTATEKGAGIGGGLQYSDFIINIAGNATVNATGSVTGAAIGGGMGNNVSKNIAINISGTPTIVAMGNQYSAGIGGGGLTDGIKIAIEGNPVITAKGGGMAGFNTRAAAGIGAGNGDKNVGISIAGGYVTATGTGTAAHDIGRGNSIASTFTLDITGGSVVPTRATSNSNITTYTAVDPTNGPWPVAVPKTKGEDALTGGLLVDLPGGSGSYRAYTTTDKNEHGASYKYAAQVWLPTAEYEAISVGSHDGAVAEVDKRAPNATTLLNHLYWATVLTYDQGTTDTVTQMPDPLSENLKPSSNYVLPSTEPVRTGHTFLGWKSSVDDAVHQAGDTITVPTVDSTFTAQWTLGLIYDGNGSTSGTVPVDDTQFSDGDEATVKGNVGNLKKSGYVFKGWSLNPDGSGQVYNEGDPLALDSDTVLYARWVAVFGVSYISSGHTSGSVPVDTTEYLAGDNAPVKGNTGNLVKKGYTFSGWTLNADGSGTVYQENDQLPITAHAVLYAKWLAIPTFGLTYSGNGNTSGAVPVDGTRYASGDIATIKGNSGNLKKSGYTFNGWSLKPDGSGKIYQQNDSLTITKNTVLYASWKAVPPTTYTVTYSGNGHASGLTPTDTNKYVKGDIATVKGNTGKLTKPGYVFAGWTLSPTGNGKVYKANDKLTINGNTVLYACWTTEQTIEVTYHGNGSNSGTVPTDANKYASGQTATVKGNSGGLGKTGYVFQGWTLYPNGSGHIYNPGDGLTLSKSTVLYARWVAVFNVTYSGNAHTAGIAPIDNARYFMGDMMVVQGNTGNMTKVGYTFGGWTLNQNGSGTVYSENDQLPISGNTILYARWIPVPTGNLPDQNTGSNNPSTTRPYVRPNVVNPAPSPRPETSVAPPSESEPQKESKTTPAPQNNREQTEQKTEPQSPEVTEIKDDGIPLGAFDANSHWSLISLIMALFALATSVVGGVLMLLGRKRSVDQHSEDDRAHDVNQRSLIGFIMGIATVGVGLLTGLLFLVLNDFSYPMAFINSWTILIGVVFIIHIALLIAYLVLRNKKSTTGGDGQADGGTVQGAVSS